MLVFLLQILELRHYTTTVTSGHSPFKPVDEKVMIVVGHGGNLAHQMCKYHVGRDAAKLRILNTHRIKQASHTQLLHQFDRQ